MKEYRRTDDVCPLSLRQIFSNGVLGEVSGPSKASIPPQIPHKSSQAQPSRQALTTTARVTLTSSVRVPRPLFPPFKSFPSNILHIRHPSGLGRDLHRVGHPPSVWDEREAVTSPCLSGPLFYFADCGAVVFDGRGVIVESHHPCVLRCILRV